MSTQIVVANIDIRQLDELYCLNDLHKASGGLNKNRPTIWLQNQQTNDLICELGQECPKAGIPALNKNQGFIAFTENLVNDIQHKRVIRENPVSLRK